MSKYYYIFSILSFNESLHALIHVIMILYFQSRTLLLLTVSSSFSFHHTVFICNNFAVIQMFISHSARVYFRAVYLSSQLFRQTYKKDSQFDCFLYLNHFIIILNKVHFSKNTVRIRNKFFAFFLLIFIFDSVCTFYIFIVPCYFFGGIPSGKTSQHILSFMFS